MKSGRGVVLLFLLVTAFVASVAAQDCEPEWANPMPPRSDLHQVFERSGFYVAVGDDGIIVTSSDRTDWDLALSDTTNSLRGVHWGEGTFVAVGDGVLLTSNDGLEWNSRDISVDGMLSGVSYGDGRFVVVGEGLGEQVLVSENGITWSLQNAGLNGSAQAVIWTGEAFLVADGFDVYGSEDGFAWSLRGTVPAKRRAPLKSDAIAIDLAWTGRKIVWVGGLEIYISDDGSQWSLSGVLGGCAPWAALSSVTADGGLVVASGVSVCPDPFLNPDSVLLTSIDGGDNWQIAGLERGEGILSVVNGNNGYVAVGRSGDVMLSSNGQTWSCPDGGCTSVGCTDDLLDGTVGSRFPMVVGGVGFCDQNKTAVGAITIKQAGGGQWSISEVTGERFRAVAWNGFRFAAVGESFTASSLDGEQWDRTELIPPATLRSLAWGGGTFVAVGTDGRVVTSGDGISWVTQFSFSTTNLLRVGYLNERFVVVGEEGAVLTSLDGFNWNLPITISGDDLSGITYDGENYLAVGGGSAVWSSPDLVDWNRAGSGVAAVFTDIVFNDEVLIAVGRDRTDSSEAAARVVVSRDGLHWTHLSSPGAALERVLWTGQEIIAVGRSRTLLTFDCLPSLIILDPTTAVVGLDQETELEVKIEQALQTDAIVFLSSSNPGLAQVPASVTISAGQVGASFTVTGLGLVSQAVITATLPSGLGGASATTLLEVEPPLPDPRRPGGRVGGG